ncbi:hypothetical protein ACH5RR_029600 [Cinchona calisaya]|uniref:Non-specific serine/threonine protein kinase n=1 Tax=Cinchona calisaya TaxID=153742 RepID=A0ABD2YTN3_9GENT
MVLLVDFGLAEEMDNGVLTAIKTSFQASSLIPVSLRNKLPRMSNIFLDNLRCLRNTMNRVPQLECPAVVLMKPELP